MAKRVGGRGSALDPAGGAYDAPPDPLVGWGGDTPPHTPPRSGSAPSALRFSRLRRFDSCAFGAQYSAPLAPQISRLRRSILAFPLLLIYEMTTDTDYTALCFIEQELLSIKVLHCRNMNFRSFWLPWPWPRPGDLHIRTKPVFSHTPGDILDLRKWTSCTKDFSSYSIKGGKCVHLVKCVHFLSRNKEGGHTIQSAVVENTMLHVNLMALFF